MTSRNTSGTWIPDIDRFVRLPIMPGAKRPIVRDWPNLDPDSPEISIPFAVFTKQGMHINVGYRLDGLVVIDCDSPEAVMWWRNLGHDCSYITSGRPERQSFWYRAPTGWEPGTFRPRADVEVRSGCGAQCLVPPSIHPTTKRPYVWLGRGAPERPSALPVLSMVLLTELLALRPARDESGGNGGTWDCWPEGERDERLTSVAGWLKEKGATEAALLLVIPAINQALCVPPIKDPERIARSVARMRDLEIEWGDEEWDDTIPDREYIPPWH